MAYNYTYSIPYLLMFLFLIVCTFVEFKQINRGKVSQSLKLCVCALLVVFFGLRGFVHTDWIAYYKLFDDLPTIWDTDFGDLFVQDFEGEMEVGFRLYSSILKSLIPEYHSWVFISTVIDIWLLHLFISRYSKYYALAFLVFFVFQGFIIEINLMRNIKSILLFLLSLKYLESRRIGPYMALNLLGCLFHITSVIYLPMYFILHKQWPRWLLYLFLIGSSAVFVMQVPFLTKILLSGANLLGGRNAALAEAYINLQQPQEYGIGIGFLERLCTYILVLIYSKRLILQNRSNIMFINMFVLYYVFFTLSTDIEVIATRLPLLFIASYWVLYPNIYNLFNKISEKAVFMTLFCLYGAIKMMQSNNNILAKYDNLLFGIESYESRKTDFSVYGNELIND